QISRPLQILRFSERGQLPETLATVNSYVPMSQVLELPDARILFTARFDGRERLLVAKPTGELSTFVDTEEESRAPAVLVGPDRVAFILGSPPRQFIAIASVKDGRVLQRQLIKASGLVLSMTTSPDGTAFFYA